MKPGRPPFMQTGRGIPSPFLQPKTNIGTGEDLQAQADRLAKEKLQKNIESKPLEGSKDTRTETATVTAVEKGKKVERFAKTPAEIAAWKAAPQENKEKYIDKTLTATGTASDTGKDTTPVTPPIDPPKKTYGKYYREHVAGSFTESGYLDPNTTLGAKSLDAKQRKNVWDKSEIEGDLSHNRNLKNSSQNTFDTYDISEDEDRISNYFGSQKVSPYDVAWKDSPYIKNQGTGEERRQAYIQNSLAYINKKESEKKVRTDAKAQSEANAKAKAEAFKNKQLENKQKIMENKAKNAAPKQMKPKGSAAKMKKC